MELDFKVKWNCLYSHDHFLWIRWSLNSSVLKWLHLLNGIRRLVYCHSEWRSGCIDQICLSCTLNGHPPSPVPSLLGGFSSRCPHSSLSCYCQSWNALELCNSKWGCLTSCTSITGEHVRLTGSQTPPQTEEIRIFILTRFSSDFYAHESLRTFVYQ